MRTAEIQVLAEASSWCTHGYMQRVRILHCASSEEPQTKTLPSWVLDNRLRGQLSGQRSIRGGRYIGAQIPDLMRSYRQPVILCFDVSWASAGYNSAGCTWTCSSGPTCVCHSHTEPLSRNAGGSPVHGSEDPSPELHAIAISSQSCGVLGNGHSIIHKLWRLQSQCLH